MSGIKGDEAKYMITVLRLWRWRTTSLQLADHPAGASVAPLIGCSILQQLVGHVLRSAGAANTRTCARLGSIPHGACNNRHAAMALFEAQKSEGTNMELHDSPCYGRIDSVGCLAPDLVPK